MGTVRCRFRGPSTGRKGKSFLRTKTENGSLTSGRYSCSRERRKSVVAGNRPGPQGTSSCPKTLMKCNPKELPSLKAKTNIGKF